MKKLILSALAIATIASVITSCKKGPEDPAFSLRSRTGRVAGVWKVSTYTSTENTAYNNNNATRPESRTETVTTTTTDGASIVRVEGETGSRSEYDNATNAFVSKTYTTNDTYNGTITTWSYDFKDDVTFTSVEDIKLTSHTSIPAPFALPTAWSSTRKTESSGVWNFLGKVDANTKNKEEMAISVLDVTSTSTDYVANGANTDTQGPNISKRKFARNENVEVWRLVRLANKEMKVTTTADNSGSGSGSSTKVRGTTTTTTTTTNGTSSSKVMGSFTLVQ